MINPPWKQVNEKILGGRKAESVRFTGAGGHGLIKASVLLAQAGVYDNMNVLQSQVYGAEARGGATKGETVVRKGKIFYPTLVIPDVLISLTKEGLDKYGDDVTNDGLIIYDSGLITDVVSSDDGPYMYGLPMWVELIKELGKGIAINILTLGVLIAMTGIVSRASIEKAITEAFRQDFKKSNMCALELGHELVKEIINE